MKINYQILVTRKLFNPSFDINLIKHANSVERRNFFENAYSLMPQTKFRKSNFTIK